MFFKAETTDEDQIRQGYSRLSTEDLINVLFEKRKLTPTASKVWREILLERGLSHASVQKIIFANASDNEVDRLNKLFDKLAGIIDKSGYEISGDQLRRKKEAISEGWRRVQAVWLYVCALSGIIVTWLLIAVKAIKEFDEIAVTLISAAVVYFLPMGIIKLVQWVRAGFLEDR